MELPAVSKKKTAPTRKTKRTQMGMSSFTKPEMEAALLLIQLSSDSDRRSTTCTTKSGGDDEFRVLIKLGMDETQKREHSDGSCNDNSKNNYNYYYNYNSDVTSAMSATADIGPLAEKDLEVDDDHDDDNDDVACGPRRKIKKFRSLDELYRLTEPL